MIFRRYLAWRQRNKQRPQIWDKSPTDWRYFGRSLLVSLPIGLIIGIVLDVVFGDPITLRVLGSVPYFTGFMLGIQWLPTVVARHTLDRTRRQAGIPYRPFPVWATVTGLAAIIALFAIGYLALDRAPFGSSDNIMDATGRTFGSLIAAGLLAAWWGGKALESLRNRAMLDEEWRQEQWRRAQTSQPTNQWTNQSM